MRWELELTLPADEDRSRANLGFPRAAQRVIWRRSKLLRWCGFHRAGPRVPQRIRRHCSNQPTQETGARAILAIVSKSCGVALDQCAQRLVLDDVHNPKYFYFDDGSADG